MNTLLVESLSKAAGCVAAVELVHKGRCGAVSCVEHKYGLGTVACD